MFDNSINNSNQPESPFLFQLKSFAYLWVIISLPMSQVRLFNATGRAVLAGEMVRMIPSSTTSFTVAQINDFGIFGSVSAIIQKNQYGLINLIGSVNWSNVIGAPTIGRGLSTNDFTNVEKGKLASFTNYDGPKITVSPTAPVNPSKNDIWIQSN